MTKNVLQLHWKTQTYWTWLKGAYHQHSIEVSVVAHLGAMVFHVQKPHKLIAIGIQSWILYLRAMVFHVHDFFVLYPFWVTTIVIFLDICWCLWPPWSKGHVIRSSVVAFRAFPVPRHFVAAYPQSTKLGRRILESSSTRCLCLYTQEFFIFSAQLIMLIMWLDCLLFFPLADRFTWRQYTCSSAHRMSATYFRFQ
jgi:hypothetical protein